MAQRRMTSLDVIDTDAFLDMPVSSQLLYFHLNARADDDGFVSSPNKIVRTLGCSTDDLKILIGKKFLIAFSDGVCVIKHWRVNNFVRKDIYKETQYLDLKQTLFIRGNGAYTLSDDDRAIPVPHGHFKLDSVNATLTKRQLSIGKEREELPANAGGDRELKVTTTPSEEEDRPAKRESTAKYPHALEVFSWFPNRQKSWEAMRNVQEREYAEFLYERGEEDVKRAIAYVWNHRSEEFCPKVTKPSDLEKKWEDIKAYAKRNS